MSLICSILSTQTTAVRQGSEMRRSDTMTTEPDIWLECSLFKQMIIAGNLSESVLEQRVLEWVETRLNFSDPGFHLLGPKLDAICDEIVLRRDEYNLVRTQYERALKLQPGKIVEVEQVHASILKNQSGENLEEKKIKLDEWLAGKVDTIKTETKMLRNKHIESEGPLMNKVRELMHQVRKPEGVHDTDLPSTEQQADDMVDEVTKLLESMNTAVTAQDSILTKRTLELGESGTPEREESHKDAAMIGPTIEHMLPENQLGDPTIFPPAASPDSVASAPEPERKKVLIVPPNCDVPIKQTMVNIFAKTNHGQSEPPDESMVSPENTIPPPEGPNNTEKVQVTQEGSGGEMRVASCEETAVQYIQKLEDGPTKQALMSLCEASLTKVGYHMMCCTSSCK